MCPGDGNSSRVADLEQKAWELYQKTVDHVSHVNPVPLPPLTQDGSQQMALPGQLSLPSHGEMQDLEACLSWALASLGSSGKLPDKDQLFSFAQKQGVGPVGFIIMPLSIVHVVSLYVLISSGETDAALQMLESTMHLEAPQDTWRSTSSKMKAASVPSTSSTPPGKLPVSKGTSSPDLAVPTKPTSRGRKRSSAKKKKTPTRSTGESRKDQTVSPGGQSQEGT